MKQLKKCKRCGEYTMNECCGETQSINPPKWSPEDRWSKWRRKGKEMLRGAKNDKKGTNC